MDETSEQRLLFVGLGNPGKEYAQTRHNLGFMVVEEFAHSHGWTLKEEKWFKAYITKGVLKGKTIDLLMPMTYMNLSGWSIREYIDYYKLTVGQIVVVCDDTALPFGQIRIRLQGSAGGHNGLKSVIADLGTEEFTRLRMGVGPNAPGQPLADYVLSEFTAEEKAALGAFVKQGAAVLDALTIETVTQVMNRINTKINVVDP